MSPLDAIDWKDVTNVSILALVGNLVVGAVLAAILAWHYVRFGRTFGNRTKLAHVLVIITVVTVFIVTLAATSVGLAIGVLAAVSIIRFRTPIKEPEELAYLFFALGIGFGLGANEALATSIAFFVVLAVLSLRSLFRRTGEDENFFVSLEVKGGSGQATVQQALDVLQRHVAWAQARRLDVQGGVLNATFQVDVKDRAAVPKAMDDLSRTFPGASVSFVEQRNAVGA